MDELKKVSLNLQPTARSHSDLALLAFDYQSTTPCDAEVVEAMAPYWSHSFGNPSSRQNRLGLYASAAVELARETLAGCLKISPDDLIFTSGATEANNLALIGYARAKALELGKPGHLITLATEHHSVLDPLRQLQKEGFCLTEIFPGPDGLLSKEQLVEAFQKDTVLVSLMLANNEIGVIQPMNEFAELCRERGVILHSDCAQAFGYCSFDLNQIGVDLLTLSAHKIYGPKGIGVLIRRKNDLPIMPLYWGGGQEQGLRPGTLPVPLIVGFAKAAEIALKDLNQNQKQLYFLRNKLWKLLTAELPDLLINGSLNNRLPHNLNFTVPGVLGGRLHRELQPFLICSSGSACSNGEPSHVLRGIGRSLKEAESSIRLSLGRYTTDAEINQAAKIITSVIEDLRN